MAFAGASSAAVNQGPDLELIQTEGLGFLNIAGETKLQLVSRWSDPPLPTASLLSIAAHRGLVAAAGPDAVHIATTEAVRKTLTAETNSDSDSDNDIRPFVPQATIPMQLRVSQLAFSADESFLVLSAETGGGLAVYDVANLLNSASSPPQPAFELSTNGETLRALVPNPMADKAELCALVTANGNLLMADLRQRSLRNGPSGQPVLRTQVSCAAWSSKGKQVVAGLADGSVVQMTPDGQEKAHIPKPPKLGDYYVASVSWLENDVFLVIHNPTVVGQPSEYHIITRNAKAVPVPEFVYQKLNDPVEPFGDKAPHHSVLRLRDFPPDLQDVLLVASTAVENIGLLTRSKAPLASNVAADKITHVFTTTELADDSRRAQLPMSADYNDTFPVGVALDLSSKDKVFKPIPTDEIEESPGPLPGLWVLNNEGVLVTWWIVYNESIRKGTTFPGLAAVDGGGAAAAASAVTAAPGGPFSSPKAAAPFGSAATPAAAAPAFGANVALGSTTSPWGKPANAGAGTSMSPARAPAFGAPSVIGSGSAFGASGGLGAKPSVWGSSAKTTAAPAFGQSSFGSSSPASAAPSSGGGFSAFAKVTSPFAAASSSGGGAAATSSPFASFKSTGQSGFASLSASNPSGGSIFGQASGAAKPFGSSSGSAFGAPSGQNNSTAFPPPTTRTSGSSAFGSSPFVLGTTFKADPATANDNEKTPPGTSSGGGSMFGSGFGQLLTQSSKEAEVSESKDQDMDTASSAAEPAKPEPTPAPVESTTPTTTPAPASRFFTPLTTTGMASTTLFGSASGTVKASDLLASRPGGGLFGAGTSLTGSSPTATTAEDNEATPRGPTKKQPEMDLPLPPDSSKDNALAEPPLPPDPFAKSSKASAEPPLPPDPFAKSSKASAEPPLPPDPFAKPSKASAAEPPLPPDPFAKPSKKSAETKRASISNLVEDAPLPPDPFSSKVKSNVLGKSTTTTPPTPAPANPFASMKPATRSSGTSIFSSNPPPSTGPTIANPFANLPKPPLSPSTDETSETDQSDDEVEELDDGEGSGTDVGKDISPRASELVKTPSYTTHGSFSMVGMDASTTSTFSQIDMPTTRSNVFGDRDAPTLRPMRPQEISPRSPSPQRPTAKHQPQPVVPGRLFRDDPQRSFSAPGMASHMLRETSRPPAGASGNGGGGNGLFTGRRVGRDANAEEQRRAEAQRAAEEAKALAAEDETDFMDRKLDQVLEPTLQLAECVYILDSNIDGGDSVATQAEAVYRDINRMVLVLKMNSRNIDAFLRGHSRADESSPEHKTEEDLDEADGWVLCDVDDLGLIVSRELPTKLRQSRVKGAEELLAASEALLKEAGQLRAMHEEVARVAQLQNSADAAAAVRALPLSAEQDVQQNELRRAFTRLMGQLVEAEQQVVLLRTKLSALAVAANASDVQGMMGGRRAAVPTVDAVMRTISKMTAMAEKRSGDIDVLESQMRKLGLGRDDNGSNGNKSINGNKSTASPFATPQKQLMASVKRSSGIFSPGSTQRSLFASPGGVSGTPTRRKLSGFSDADKALLRQKRADRQRTLARLQRIQQAEGPRHMRID